MSKILLSLSLACVFLIACGPHLTVMVHPKTGEAVECRATTTQRGLLAIGQQARTDCVQQYQALGYVRADDLSPAERTTIIPKYKPVVIEHR
jgi:hypothetical protein